MARPEPILESGDNLWSPDTDWHESIASIRPSGTGAFSPRTSSDTIEVEIPSKKLRSFLQNIFGYSLAQQSSPWYLTRPLIPMQHPFLPWLWASGATVTLYNPLSNPAMTAITEGVYPAKQRGIGDINSPYYTGNYTRAKVVIQFNPAHAPMSADSNVTGNQKMWWAAGTPEYQRFLGPVTVKPKLEIITAKAGTANVLKFAEQSPTSVTIGTPIPDGMSYVRKFTTEFTLMWRCVEESYLVDTSKTNYHIMPRFARLDAYLGTVNSDTSPKFCGYEPGTLMFVGYDPGERYQQPVRTTSFAGLWAYDVMLTFAYFDPPRVADSSITTAPPGSSPLKRGWHLYPNRQDNYWYYATKGASGGTYNGLSQLREANFASMFLHVNTAAGAYPT